jgi:FolB domain-containing protein
VDVELTLDLTPAALSDDLDAAVDYGQVVQRVVSMGTSERFHLIERLAGPSRGAPPGAARP